MHPTRQALARVTACAPTAGDKSAPTPALVHALPALDSARLFAGGRELIIRHAGADYRLFITRQNKLILTK